MPRALIPLLAVAFVDILGFSILIPLLPFYTEHFGGTPQTVGWLVSTVTFVAMISSPVLGALSDRFGRRGALICAQIATTAGYVLLGTATSVPQLFLARAIEGLGGGSMGLTQAYIGDVTTPAERAASYGKLGAVFGIAFVFGPAMGGTLVRFGYSVPFFAAAAVSLVTIALTLVMLPESHTRREEGPGLRATFAALAAPALRRLLFVQFCFTLAFTMWISILALFLQRILHFGAGEAGLFYAFSGVIGVLMQVFVVGRVVGRIGERYTLVAGLSCMALVYVAAAAIGSLATMLVAAFVWSAGTSLTRPALSALVSHSAESQRGAIMGASDAISSLAFILGAPIATAVFTRDVRLVGVLPAVLCVIAVAFALRIPGVATVTEQAA